MTTFNLGKPLPTKMKISFRTDRIYTTDECDIDGYAVELLNGIFRLDVKFNEIVVINVGINRWLAENPSRVAELKQMLNKLCFEI